MAVLETLVLYVFVPVGVAVVASLLMRSAAQETIQSLPSGALPDQGRGRLPVGFALAAAPIPLGLVMWTLVRPIADAIDAGTMVGAADATSLLFWAAVAFAFAAAASGASLTLCTRSRMGNFLGSDFGRVLPVAVIPFTGVVFGLVLNFLLLGYLLDFIPGGAGTAFAAAAPVQAVVSAFQAYTVATLAFPAATLASNRVRDTSQRGFLRAVVLMEAGELPVLLGLIWAFLAIGGL